MENADKADDIGLMHLKAKRFALSKLKFQTEDCVMSAETSLEMPMIWNSYSDSISKLACKFWEGQSELLDHMQDLASGWFDRRHVGTRAALSAVQKACTAKGPVDVAACYQDWVAGAASRILDDQVAYQRFVHVVISSLASFEPEQPVSVATVSEWKSRAA